MAVDDPPVDPAHPIPSVRFFAEVAVPLHDAVAVRERFRGAQFAAQVGVGEPEKQLHRTEVPVPKGTVRRSSGNRASEW